MAIERIEVVEPYVDARQQHAAYMMGIYVFLASEVMLFGGIFAVAYVIRILHPLAYIEASKRLHVWIGGINTVVLLTSSLAVALAVHLARDGKARHAAWSLLAAVALGIGFLGIKGYEYTLEYHEGTLPVSWADLRFSSQVEHQFMNLYLIGTALHAVHLTIGVLLLGGLAVSLFLRKLKVPKGALLIAVFGVYWHLVDIIWIFLYPALYLAR